MISNYLDVDFLKKNHKMIHAFGLGFIQIKISESHRVHIYCPEVQITTGDEDIHDHRYNFKSYILKGSLINKIYVKKDGNDFQAFEENCSPNKESEEKKISLCSVKLINSVDMAAGSSYFMEKDTLHRVETTRCITLLERESASKEKANVIVPIGSKDICPFSANMSSDILWKIVEKEISDVY